MPVHENFGNMKELIEGITDEEISEIAFFLIKEGMNIDTLDKLAKKVESHVKSEAGLKFLYFTLGRIETFETIFVGREKAKELHVNFEDVLEAIYQNFLNTLKNGAIEYMREKEQNESESKEGI